MLKSIHNINLHFLIIATIIIATTLFAESVQAQIQFKKGWNSPENSNAKKYTEKQVITFLSGLSNEFEKMIDKSACFLQVTKGCHYNYQKNDPHFTLNGIKSQRNCKSIYAGSKSIHLPCNNTFAKKQYKKYMNTKYTNTVLFPQK
jgi:hypothetical protein